jgi:hypothetical protein
MTEKHWSLCQFLLIDPKHFKTCKQQSVLMSTGGTAINAYCQQCWRRHSDMNCLSNELVTMTLCTWLKIVTASRFFVDNYFRPLGSVLRACKYEHTGAYNAVQLAKLGGEGQNDWLLYKLWWTLSSGWYLFVLRPNDKSSSKFQIWDLIGGLVQIRSSDSILRKRFTQCHVAAMRQWLWLHAAESFLRR